MIDHIIVAIVLIIAEDKDKFSVFGNFAGPVSALFRFDELREVLDALELFRVEEVCRCVNLLLWSEVRCSKPRRCGTERTLAACTKYTSHSGCMTFVQPVGNGPLLTDCLFKGQRSERRVRYERTAHSENDKVMGFILSIGGAFLDLDLVETDMRHGR